MDSAGEVSPFFVLLCAHGPRKGTQLTYLKDQPGRFPTELVAERLREQLEFRPADGDQQLELRGIFYATTPEAAQTAALLLGGIAAPKATRVLAEQLAAIRSAACDGNMRPLKENADVIGVDGSINEVPVRPCPLLRQEKFQAGADWYYKFAGCLIAAARKGPARASCGMNEPCCLKQEEPAKG